MEKEYTQAERDAYIDGHDAGYDAGWKAAIEELSANGNLRSAIPGDEVLAIASKRLGICIAFDDDGGAQIMFPTGNAYWLQRGEYTLTGNTYADDLDKLLERLNRADLEYKEHANVEAD